MNRVGDFGFLIGIILTYWTAGTVNLVELADFVDFDPSVVTSFLGLALACGFIGKSAQFPYMFGCLMQWLPHTGIGFNSCCHYGCSGNIPFNQN